MWPAIKLCKNTTFIRLYLRNYDCKVESIRAGTDSSVFGLLIHFYTRPSFSRTKQVVVGGNNTFYTTLCMLLELQLALLFYLLRFYGKGMNLGRARENEIAAKILFIYMIHVFSFHTNIAKTLTLNFIREEICRNMILHHYMS